MRKLGERWTHQRQSVLLEYLVLVLPLVGNEGGEQPPVLGDVELGARRRLEGALVERDDEAWCQLLELKMADGRGSNGERPPKAWKVGVTGTRMGKRRLGERVKLRDEERRRARRTQSDNIHFSGLSPSTPRPTFRLLLDVRVLPEPAERVLSTWGQLPTSTQLRTHGWSRTARGRALPPQNERVWSRMHDAQRARRRGA